MPDVWQPPVPPEQVIHTGAGWYRLAGFVRAALALNVLVYAIDMIGSWWAAGTLGDWLDDPRTVSLSDAQRIDTLNQATASAEVLLLLVTGVLFTCWIYQAYNRPLAERSALALGRGWAIGGWLIPFANFVLPYRVVQGVHRATARPARPDSRLIICWWAAWVVLSLGSSWSRVAGPDTATVEGRELIRALRTVDLTSSILAVPAVVAAVLGAVVVTQLTARVRDVAEAPPSVISN